MKKIVLLFLGVILISGCSNNKEKELCDKIDELDVTSFTKNGEYENLILSLESNYNMYCKNKDSEVCKKLEEYIQAAKSEIKQQDCSEINDSLKNVCEINNESAISDKANNVNYMHEEVWAVCNK